jgi:hypothetical protein
MLDGNGSPKSILPSLPEGTELTMDDNGLRVMVKDLLKKASADVMTGEK